MYRALREAKFNGFKFFRKPTENDLSFIKDYYKINQKQFDEIDREDVDFIYFKDFKSFILSTDESFPEFFVAEIEKEGVLLFVNTEGFDYPRYVAFIPEELAL